jgi:hypothetical protein
MVPFTEASIEHSIDGSLQRRHLAAVLVNREQIDSVVETVDEQVEMPDVPFDTDTGPLLKDFTGDVYAEGETGLPDEVVE